MVQLFGKPLENWKNPDILYEDEFRAHMLAEFPEEMQVIDWPDLRAEFSVHEDKAKAGKGASRTLGTWAAILGGLGSAGVALGSLLADDLRKWVVLLSLVAVILGVMLGVAHKVLPGRSNWLSHRIKAERLRAGYFQLILDNFELVAAAIGDAGRRPEWDQIRAVKLPQMLNRLDEDDAGDWVSWLEDGDLQRAWLTDAKPLALLERCDRAIQEAVAAPGPAQTLMERLYVQRIEVQHSFSVRATVQTLLTASGRARIIRALSVLTIISVPILAFLASLALLDGREADAIALIAVSSGIAAISLLVGLLDRGLSDEKDDQRYLDYKKRVAHERKRFQDARQLKDLENQVRALFALEHHAYWETRQFLLDHRNDHFL